MMLEKSFSNSVLFAVPCIFTLTVSTGLIQTLKWAPGAYVQKGKFLNAKANKWAYFLKTEQYRIFLHLAPVTRLSNSKCILMVSEDNSFCSITSNIWSEVVKNGRLVNLLHTPDTFFWIYNNSPQFSQIPPTS